MQRISSPPHTQALDCMTFTPVPAGTSLMLPEVYDWHLAQSSRHPLFVYIDSSGTKRSLTWAEGVKAIYRTANAVINRLGFRDTSVRTTSLVMLFATPDRIPFFIATMAVMRAGYPVFLVSPRTPAAALARLLSTVDVAHVIASDDPEIRKTLYQALDNIHCKNKAYRVDISPMFTYDELFSAKTSLSTSDVAPLVSLKAGDVALILHSSGSSSDPKVITWTHRMLMQQFWVFWYGNLNMAGEVLSTHAMPTGGASGIRINLLAASCGMIISAFRPSNPPITPTSSSILQEAKQTGTTFVFCRPSWIEKWSRDSSALSILRSFKGVFFSGCPVVDECGNRCVESGVRLTTFYGSSECGLLNHVFTDIDGDWDYFKISPHCDAHFLPDPSGAFELALKPCTSHTPSLVNAHVDGAPAYRTKDLFVKHPNKPNYWKYIGRTDDQITLTTGEKLNVGVIERILLANRPVAGAIVFSRRPHSGLGVIVDLSQEYFVNNRDESSIAALKEEIWPCVECVNATSSDRKTTRIAKEAIIIVSPTTPLTYGMKDTPLRKDVLRAYDAEIKALSIV